MKVFQCAICPKKVINALVCNNCKREYDLTEEWAQMLMAHEKAWRASNLRDERHGVVTFTDYQVARDGVEYDGWDVLDGEIGSSRTNDAFVNSMGMDDENFSDDLELELLLEDHALYDLADEADLTEGEFNAFFVYLHEPHEGKRLKSEDAADALSKLEGKTVSPAAYRRRISDALTKIKPVVKVNLKGFFE